MQSPFHEGERHQCGQHFGAGNVVCPSIFQESPENEIAVRISIDAILFCETFGFANSRVFAQGFLLALFVLQRLSRSHRTFTWSAARLALHKPGGNKDGYTPLQGDEQELVPTCPHPGMSPDSSAVTMAGIAQLLQQQLEPITANIGSLQTTREHLTSKYGELKDVVEARLQRMESRMDMSETRVNKLEEVGQQLQAQISKIKDFVRDEVGTVLLEKKVGVLADKNVADKRSVTAVIGNLEGLKSLGEAQAWLKNKLAVLDSPSPTQVYAKGMYKGMVFAEFKDTFERDMAVTLLRTAGLKNDGKQVWASQDRDPVDRAARNFCYGLKRLFKEHWEVPYNVNISEVAPYTLTVGGELALTAHVSKHAIDYEWHGDWLTWKELHDSQGVKDLLQKFEELIMRTSKGSKGSVKGTSKGANRP